MSARFSRPINLFSGLLGHGKTLALMTYAIEARAERSEEFPNGQQLFQLGINGCDPVIAPVWCPDETFDRELLLDVNARDPARREAAHAERLRALSRWRELPAGSILLVDEIQDYLPTRDPGRPPEWIAELAKIRHFGVQLWATTQDPRNIDAFVRRLICDHVHIERKGGLSGAVTFRWERCAPDPTDYHARKNAVKGAFKYDKSVFKTYTSSAQHLVRRSIPWQVWGTAIAVLVAGVACYFAARVFLGRSSLASGSHPVAGVVAGSSTASAPVPPVVAPSTSPALSSSVAGQGVSFLGKSVPDYIAMFVPRVAVQPWSAPAFDDRKPLADPQIFCVIAEEKGCRCYTEQVTRIAGIPDYQCRLVASQGVYNPFKAPIVARDTRERERERSNRSPADNRASPRADGSSPTAGADDAGAASVWPRPDFTYRVPFPKASPIGGR